MINYELAKRLKDAGFPLEMSHESWEIRCKNGIKKQLLSPYFVFIEGDNYSIPTLSELIEACGEDFHCLVHVIDGEIDSDREFWSAGKGALVKDWSNGSTPEEAVAMLWLALNQKSDFQKKMDNAPDTYTEVKDESIASMQSKYGDNLPPGYVEPL